jgi:hypothetical protein
MLIYLSLADSFSDLAISPEATNSERGLAAKPSTQNLIIEIETRWYCYWVMANEARITHCYATKYPPTARL